MKTLIMLAALGICQPTLATNPYRGCFSSSIYDDDGQAPPIDRKIRLDHKKMQAIKAPLLDPLDLEIERLNALIKTEHTSRAAGLLGSWAGIFFYPPSFVLVVPFIWYQGARMGWDEDVARQKIYELKESKRQLSTGFTHGPNWYLERQYIDLRPRIPKPFRDRIESLLIEGYETGADHKKLLDDLLSFPSKIRCLSVDGNADKFVNRLILVKSQLSSQLREQHFASLDALTVLAEASFNALTNSTPSRCAVYFETHQYDRARLIFEQMAFTLELNVFVACATRDNCTNEYLFGTNGTQHGIILEAFFANKHKMTLNPLLIIIGIDEWVVNENLDILLRMLDPDPPAKQVHSNYLGLAIDWSAMSVLSCGRTPSSNFPHALQSRLHSYKID